MHQDFQIIQDLHRHRRVMLNPFQRLRLCGAQLPDRASGGNRQLRFPHLAYGIVPDRFASFGLRMEPSLRYSFLS